MNIQKTDAGNFLPLMELFHSLQGEGFHTGEAAVFVRIGGCDVGCHWCDVKESWDPGIHPLTPSDRIVEAVTAYPCRNVVVTGGEPLNYPMDQFCDALHAVHCRLFLETSGSAVLTGRWDWICLSPKKNAPPLPAIYDKADELKVIIETPDDLEWAEHQSRLVKDDCHLFLQPEWSRRKEITPLLVEYIGSNPKWKLSLQIHKYIGIP